jgi:asparagine synthase (glutamine-hydrolysing)
MCGIFGSFGPPLGDLTVRRVLATLRHRGPETQGAITLKDGLLAHTRLRIIDLSPAGAQPMTNEDGSVWVTFNGEIYNFRELREELVARGHRFKSQSDTEVIVHGYEVWGDDVVEHLDGMFALGVWDSRQRRLLLARDRPGKKPLFFVEHGDRFLFASEIKALGAAGVPLEVDANGVASYLAYGYVPAPNTIYRHVAQLPPATRLSWQPGRAPTTRRYWQVDFRARTPAPTEAEARQRVRELLTEAVRRRMVADVPVGAFLSGGLDSSIVVGLMARLGHKVRTFSIGFAGDPRYDERSFARDAARAYGTDHTEFVVSPDDFSLVEKLVWLHDGPFGDSSAIPTYVVSALTRRCVTVALNGDGGDELFAGYLRFWAAQTTERVPRPLRPVAGLFAHLLPGGTGSRSLVARSRRMLEAIQRPLGDRLVAWNSYFAFSLPGMLRPELMGAAASVLEYHRSLFRGLSGRSALAQSLQHNFETYLAGDLLVKVDRSSMAHALETRSPFLDTALMEYVAGLPDHFKLRGRTTKYLLRQSFADLLPPRILSRGKMGFGLPLGTWFRGDLRNYLSDHLESKVSRITEFVRPEAVREVMDAHMQGRADHEHQLWSLLTLELWLRNLPRMAGPWQDGPPEAWASAPALATAASE